MFVFSVRDQAWPPRFWGLWFVFEWNSVNFPIWRVLVPSDSLLVMDCCRLLSHTLVFPAYALLKLLRTLVESGKEKRHQLAGVFAVVRLQSLVLCSEHTVLLSKSFDPNWTQNCLTSLGLQTWLIWIYCNTIEYQDKSSYGWRAHERRACTVASCTRCHVEIDVLCVQGWYSGAHLPLWTAACCFFSTSCWAAGHANHFLLEVWILKTRLHFHPHCCVFVLTVVLTKCPSSLYWFLIYLLLYFLLVLQRINYKSLCYYTAAAVIFMLLVTSMITLQLSYTWPVRR